MAIFDKAFDVVIGHEGGYQAHSADSGNYNSKNELVGTKYGISAPTLEAWLGWVPTAQDMKDLALSTAMAIYESQYWTPFRLYEIPDQWTAAHIFDLFVNHGTKGGARIVQKALNLLPQCYHTAVDGIYGSDSLAKTILAITQNCADELNEAIVAERKKLYQSIVAANPDQGEFLKGWLSRADSFLRKHPGASALAFLLVAGAALYFLTRT